jgi:hypothetical protein
MNELNYHDEQVDNIALDEENVDDRWIQKILFRWLG